MRKIICLIFSTLFWALAVNLVYVPLDLPAGGVTGLAIIFNEVFGEKTAMYVFVGNLICLIMAYVFIEKKYVLKTILGGNILLPLFIQVVPVMNISDSKIISVFVAGIFLTISMNLLELSAYSYGGSTIIGKIINDKFGIKFTKATGIIDASIMSIGIFIFGIEATILSVFSMVLMIGLNDIVRKREYYESVERFIFA